MYLQIPTLNFVNKCMTNVEQGIKKDGYNDYS